MLPDKRTEHYPTTERSSSETNLTDEVVIVTGSGRGIGRAIALDFARSGANLVLVDLDLETLNSVKDETSVLGARASSFGQMLDVLEIVDRHGKTAVPS